LIDPNVKDVTTGFNGDNDPLDVCEIGSKIHERGAVVQVKVLGALGLIDEGEADWKIIAIDVNDPLAAKLNDINDVEAQLPGLLDATRDWFRIYKVPTGKPANIFAESGRFYDRAFALKQIQHDYDLWHDLIVKNNYAATPEKQKGISLLHTSELAAKVGVTTADEAAKIVGAESEEFKPEPAKVDQVAIDTVYYIDRTKL
jgi:inorganic pyrophosphatase